MNIEKDHAAKYRFEFKRKPNQCWQRPSSDDYKRHRQARRRAALIDLRRRIEEAENE